MKNVCGESNLLREWAFAAEVEDGGNQRQQARDFRDGAIRRRRNSGWSSNSTGRSILELIAHRVRWQCGLRRKKLWRSTCILLRQQANTGGWPGMMRKTRLIWRRTEPYVFLRRRSEFVCHQRLRGNGYLRDLAAGDVQHSRRRSAQSRGKTRYCICGTANERA